MKLKRFIMLAMVACAAMVSCADGIIWYYEIIGDGAHITGCSSNVGDIEIPPSLEGYPVRDWEDALFKGAVGLRSVKIPGSVTNIAHQTFEGCTDLRDLPSFA